MPPRYCSWDALPVPCTFTRSTDKSESSPMTLLDVVESDGAVTLQCCDKYGEVVEIEFTPGELEAVRFKVLDAVGYDKKEATVPNIDDGLEARLQDIYSIVGDAKKRGKRVKRLLPEMSAKLGFDDVGLDVADACRYLEQHCCRIEDGSVKLPEVFEEKDVDFAEWAALVRQDGTYDRVSEAKAKVEAVEADNAEPVEEAPPEVLSEGEETVPEFDNVFEVEEPDDEPEFDERRVRLCILESTLGAFRARLSGKVDTVNLAVIAKAIEAYTTKPMKATGRPPYADVADVDFDPELVVTMLADEAGCYFEPENQTVTPPEGFDPQVYTAETWLDEIEAASGLGDDLSDVFGEEVENSTAPPMGIGFGEGADIEPLDPTPAPPVPEPVPLTVAPVVQAEPEVEPEVDDGGWSEQGRVWTNQEIGDLIVRVSEDTAARLTSILLRVASDVIDGLSDLFIPDEEG